MWKQGILCEGGGGRGRLDVEEGRWKEVPIGFCCIWHYWEGVVDGGGRW